MQSQSRIQTKSDTLSPAAITPLAKLSPIGGTESAVLTFLLGFGIAALCLGQWMVPILGGFGTALLIVGLALMIERLCRPLVQWAIGRHVYSNLMKVGGRGTAIEVARIYSQGRTISTSQLETLIKRNAQLQGRESGGASQ